MWTNYSEWLREAKSTFSKSSATSRAKAAASGVMGGTPAAIQEQQETDFQTELKTLRKGTTAKDLAKLGARYTEPQTRVSYGPYPGEGERRAETRTQVPARFAPGSKDYGKYADIFREQTGAEPEPWEVYFTKRYGFKGFEISERDKAVFRAEGAAGKRALGASVKGSQTSSPWV